MSVEAPPSPAPTQNAIANNGLGSQLQNGILGNPALQGFHLQQSDLTVSTPHNEMPILHLREMPATGHAVLKATLEQAVGLKLETVPGDMNAYRIMNTAEVVQHGFMNPELQRTQPTPVVASPDPQKVIGSAGWQRNDSSVPRTSVCIEGWTEEQKKGLTDALTKQGISFSERHSDSLGGNTLCVTRVDVLKIENAINTQATTVITRSSPDLQPESIRLDANGTLDISCRASGANTATLEAIQTTLKKAGFNCMMVGDEGTRTLHAPPHNGVTAASYLASHEPEVANTRNQIVEGRSTAAAKSQQKAEQPAPPPIEHHAATKPVHENSPESYARQMNVADLRRAMENSATPTVACRPTELILVPSDVASRASEAAQQASGEASRDREALAANDPSRPAPTRESARVASR